MRGGGGLDGLSGRWGGSRVSASGIARERARCGSENFGLMVEPDCRWPVLDWGKVGSDVVGPLVSDPLSSISSLDKKLVY